MIGRAKLLSSAEWWFAAAQTELYREVTEYMEREGLNQNQLAEKLGVSKGYISQILKGQFNYTLKKLIELSMAVGKVPVISYRSIDDIVKEDRKVKPAATVKKASRRTDARRRKTTRVK